MIFGQSNRKLLSGDVVKQPFIVYTPDSQIKTPKILLRAMWRDLIASRELSWRLFVRDLSAQYRQSMFGILWAFIPPVVTGLIFIFLQSRNVVNFGDTDIPYGLYVMIGTILWQLFTESLNAPLKAVTAAKSLVVKINFPREALVVSAFYMVMFNLMIKMVVIAVFLLIYRLPVSWGLLAAPAAVFMLVLLGMSIGLLLTPIGMLYTDVATSLPIILQIFFFVTPVVYPTPETWPLSLLAVLNPVSPLLIAARDLMTKGTIANLEPFLVISGITLVVLMISWLIYRLAMPVLIERMSA